MTMSARMLHALPVYFGGKRRLLGAIFRDIPTAEEAPTFVDAFLGGGAVSLYAKARGYRVICNDVAERSAIAGHALIANDRVKLSYDDLVRLCVYQDERHYARDNLAPDTFMIEHARFLDTILHNAEDFSEPKRSLARLLAVKFALRLRPMGNFGAKTIVHQAAAGAWEDMNPNYVRDIVNRGLPGHPIRVAEKLRKAINAGIFFNGCENEAHQKDVFEFLGNVTGDIVYLDPPYSGTQSYEKALRQLDAMLVGEEVDAVASRFSSDAPQDVLPELFAAADHIPTWVVSYGNARIELAELMALVRKYRRNVEGAAFRFTHCRGNAGEESSLRNRELLVIGRP